MDDFKGKNELGQSKIINDTTINNEVLTEELLRSDAQAAVDTANYVDWRSKPWKDSVYKIEHFMRGEERNSISEGWKTKVLETYAHLLQATTELAEKRKKILSVAKEDTPEEERPDNWQSSNPLAIHEPLEHGKNDSKPESNPDIEPNYELIQRAFITAYTAHETHKRKSGEPYILHPIAVAQIVVEEIGLDSVSVASALLHDVVEDSEDYTIESMHKEFGETIGDIIDGLTKIKGVIEDDRKNPSWVNKQADNIKKILLTLGKDARVILIKTADRLHNMRTLGAMRPEKQKRIASETMFLYAPISHRLGLYRIKSELEDLSMKYLKPLMYKEIANKLNEKKDERETFIANFIRPLRSKIEASGYKARIFGRSKHIYSIYNKMISKQVEFDDIYDLLAIRIILDVPEVDERSSCFHVYSMVTELYTPIESRYRDWISIPKANGYESLHTTVVGPTGKWIEIQIRSERMDRVAERGVAAHWRYKGQREQQKFDNWFNDIRDVLQASANDSSLEFINNFKHSFHDTEIFALTPNGDIKNLPTGATVLDFAYTIHTDVGNHCVGANVDGKLRGITHVLESGSRVKILTTKKQKPSKEWLNTAITSRARTCIKSWLKNERLKQAVLGEEILERKLRRQKVKLTKELSEQLAHYFKFPDSLEFHYAISQKRFDFQQLKDVNFVNGQIERKTSEAKKPGITDEKIDKIQAATSSYSDITILGGFADKIDYQMAKCCQPLPGDDVFGFITVDRGLRIHREDCPNAEQLKQRFPYRLLKPYWGLTNDTPTFSTKILIDGIDKVGLVNRITRTISEEFNVNIGTMNFEPGDGIFKGDIQVFVNNNKELKKLIKSLKDIKGIISVTQYRD